MLCAGNDHDPEATWWKMPFRLRLESARSKLLGSRRSSTASTAASDAASSAAVGAGSEKARSIVSQPSPTSSPLPLPPRARSSGTHSVRTPPPLSALSKESLPSPLEPEKPSQLRADQHQSRDRPSETIADRSESLTSKDLQQQAQQPPAPPPLPTLALEEPSPAPDEPPKQLGLDLPSTLAVPDLRDESDEALHPLPTPEALASPRQQRPLAVRRQSLVHNSNARVIKTLLDSQRTRPSTANSAQEDYFSINAGMLHRKIWVKRPGASATLVQIREDDLVDDVRDMILKKYANSLGRSYDSPDVVLRIVSRDPAARPMERTLGPEEEMCRTLDEYFPGGQTVDEALIIDVPQRRTPKPSPRVPLVPHVAQYYGENRPAETDADYFPPMPPALGAPSPASLTSLSHDSRQSHPHSDVRSIAVLTTGQVPPLPSPGATRQRSGRPRPHRNLTSSPTQGTHPVSSTSTSQHLSRPNRGRLDSGASETKHVAAPAAPPLPTPPAPEAAPVPQKTSTPPTPRIQSPDPRKPKRKKNKDADAPSLPSGLLDGSVPPINVLIVEDNIINLKLLEAFMKRLKVRWQTAMNGRDAVVKWRAGGFHLVLMDIQLPIMSGLEATKEIRRLERVNNIGVFSNSSASNTAPILPKERPETNGEPKANDKLGDGIIFKSPVIIVALTASSLQSDRHEALAAGCNDFLTKPVNFVWLERKVKEWGCMQALIDYDGWRKWKTFTSELPPEQNKPKTGKKKINRASMSKPPGALAAAAITSPESQALAQAVQAPATDAVVDGAVEIEDIPPADNLNNGS
ncbi:Two-component response regulator SSK1p [Diplodia seriata]|uniref:Response regulator mcs4 n=1 Tax=Diplodia seriata TaxID=420778 RepID=A0A1S8B9C1_9PEZI|nr:Response regulator mcs4 [Diplodia seriata]